jgi:hypothetical protein
MNKLKPLKNSCIGKSSLNVNKDKTNQGVTEKLLQKYLSRKFVIGIERGDKTIKQRTIS